MKCKFIELAAMLAIASLPTAVKAQAVEDLPQPQPTTTQTSEQVANACRQNQAETLPVPFSDVSPNHWAFKAVMTMHYCGAFRQAASPELFQPNSENSQGIITPTAVKTTSD